ncbi:MAG TPA: maleylpyruvate isomerase family mycothiol-dependent enzyme [Jiangellaceae bacterium]
MSIDTTEGPARDVALIPRIGARTDAQAVALAAYDRLLALLGRLGSDDWQSPTECPGWTVADMVGHVIGAARSATSLRQQLRRALKARRLLAEHGGNLLDAINAVQVREHAHLRPQERITLLRQVAPRAVAGRTNLSRTLLRRVPIANPPGGSTPEGSPDRLTVGQLSEVIWTRDVWMHTVDIARATGRRLDPARSVDGRIVEDAVAEWARRHGQPFLLFLSGPAGGLFSQGDSAAGPRINLDAIEFCRILSGRAYGTGLLATRILF